MKTIQLRGIGINNLLGYLALMGLLKALETSRPEWHVRASWKDVKPQIHIPLETNKDNVAIAAVEGIRTIGTAINLDKYKNLKLALDDFRELQSKSPNIAAALGSDGIIKGEVDGYVDYPPLCFMLGSGHQNFLERLKDATNVKKDTEKIIKGHVYAALFDTWEYSTVKAVGKSKKSQYMVKPFRWDPLEYRPHAYRGKDPSGDDIQTVPGAQILAAVGFTCIFCAPTNKGLGSLACNNEMVIWPIWNKPLSLSAILILMSHPIMKMLLDGQHDDNIRGELRLMGVERVMAANIFWDGKYRNVTPASRIA